MNSSFSASKYVGIATAATWTYGWFLVAHRAWEHFAAAGDNAAVFNVIVSLAVTAIGCWMTFRVYPRRVINFAEKSYPREPWHRRLTGWFGATVWCLVAVLWNLAIFRMLVEIAGRGQSLSYVILIPFSLIGLFLLLVLFTGIALILDSLIKPGQPASPTASAEPAVEEPPRLPPAPAAGRAKEADLKDTPILGSLFIIVFVNWFVFAGISIYLGGDAVGILPSLDGFVVKSHGNHKAVSEAAWIFSLYYSTATLLLSPLVVFLFAARQMGSRLFKTEKWLLKVCVGMFLLVWVVGWYSSIGGSFLRSLEDWQKLKHSTPAPEPSRQAPEAAKWLRVVG